MAVGAGRWNGRRLRRAFRCLVVLPALAALSACQDTNSWRQKLTVTVETPQGEVTGSSVVRVVSSFGQVPLSNSEVGYKVTGEAAVVEIAPGRYLFALLGNSEAERFYRALGYNYADRGEKLDRIARMQGESRVLKPDNYPLLVTFADIADPKTVRRVEPDNLAASFGPGVRLKAITLEITDEKVTEGRVEGVLGWWCGYRKRGARLSGSTSIAISDNELSNNLGTGSFKIGDC